MLELDGFELVLFEFLLHLILSHLPGLNFELIHPLVLLVFPPQGVPFGRNRIDFLLLLVKQVLLLPDDSIETFNLCLMAPAVRLELVDFVVKDASQLGNQQLEVLESGFGELLHEVDD
jgi:hypothetical protein